MLKTGAKIFGFVGGIPLAVWSMDSLPFWKLLPATLLAIAYIAFVGYYVAEKLGCGQLRRKQAAGVAAVLAAVLYAFPLAEAWRKDNAVRALEPQVRELEKFKGREPILEDAANVYARLRFAEAASGYYFSNPRDGRAAFDRQAATIPLLLSSPRDATKSTANHISIRIAPNTYWVLLKEPRQINSEVRFVDLPSGVSAEVSDASSVGFTVRFSPTTTLVENFRFMVEAGASR